MCSYFFNNEFVISSFVVFVCFVCCLCCGSCCVFLCNQYQPIRYLIFPFAHRSYSFAHTISVQCKINTKNK